MSEEANPVNGKIMFEDDNNHHKVDESAKGHTFRRRRLTYTRTDLADAINSAGLQVLVDSDGDAEEGDRDSGVNDAKSIESNEVTIDAEDAEDAESQQQQERKEAHPLSSQTAAATTKIKLDNDSNDNSNDNNNDSPNTSNSEQSNNQLEAKVLHASAPPLPKDCMKRRGSLLYIHHEDDEDQQPLKKSRLREDNEDDETGSISSDEVEWKKKRHSSIHAEDDTLPFPRHVVGTYSCHGIEPVYDETDQNSDFAPFIAKINQDRGGVAFPYANNSKMAVFAAYDGHGDGGEHVAQYALHEIPRRLELHDDFYKGNFEKAFKEVFVSVDKDLACENDIEPKYSGCTACVAFLNDNVFHLANAGDSRAVMACRSIQNGKIVRQALDLTIDQNPDSPGEQERIVEMGGFVSPPPEEGLSARVWLDCNYSQIGLAMSRSLGDHAVKSIGVIATPVVSTHELTENDEFMIIATDGVWEFMSSQEAVDIVSKHLDNGNGSSVACQNLIESAAGLWHENEGDYRDDITALVIKVQELWKN